MRCLTDHLWPAFHIILKVEIWWRDPNGKLFQMETKYFSVLRRVGSYELEERTNVFYRRLAVIILLSSRLLRMNNMINETKMTLAD